MNKESAKLELKFLKTTEFVKFLNYLLTGKNS